MQYGRASDVRRQTASLYRPPPKITVFDAACEILIGKQGRFDGELSPYMREPMNATVARAVRKVVFAGPGRCTKTLGLVTGLVAYTAKYDQGDFLVVCASKDAGRRYSRQDLSPVIEASPKIAEIMSKRKTDDNIFDKKTASGMSINIAWPTGSQLAGATFRRVAATEYDSADDDIEDEGSLDTLMSKRVETHGSAASIVVESSIRRSYRVPDWRAPPEFPHLAAPVTGITGLYNTGTRKWFYWRCPGCSAPIALNPDIHQMFPIPPILELIDILPGVDAAKWAREHAYIPCKGCGFVITEDLRRPLNIGGVWVPDGCKLGPDGEIVGDPIDTDIDSYHLSCVAAAYARWAGILTKYAVAIQHYVRTGEESEIKSTVNLDQGRAHLSLDVIHDAIGTQRMAHTGEDWPQGTVPPGVRFLTGQIDVQAGKRAGFVVKVTGWGVGLQQWPVDRYILHHSERLGPDGRQLQLDPASFPEDWERIVKKVITRRYPLHEPGATTQRTMVVHFVVCDSGGAAKPKTIGRGKEADRDSHQVLGADRVKVSVTSNAYTFYRSLQARGLHVKFRLYKGASSSDAPIWRETKPDSSDRKDRSSGAKGDVPVLLLNVDKIKDAVSGHYKRPTVGDNYHHIPGWYLADEAGHPRKWLEQRNAEIPSDKGWVRIRLENEEFDLDVMGQAAVHRLGADRIDWDNPPSYADVWEKNSGVSGPDVPPPPKPKPAPFRPKIIRSNHMRR